MQQMVLLEVVVVGIGLLISIMWMVLLYQLLLDSTAPGLDV